MKRTIDAFTRIPIDQLIKPIDGFAWVLLKRWWLVTENNEILLYGPGRAPQCNANRTIALLVAQHYDFPTTLRQIHIAYLPHNCGDYQH